MTAVGITGADGFVGFHLRCRLRATRPGLPIRVAGRGVFATEEGLDAFVSSCDQIVHLAGANRGTELEVHDTNLQLATKLIESMRRTNSRASVAFSNTTLRGRDSAYGRSKEAAASMFSKWAAGNGSTFADVILPNLFGEYGKPFYNSVVSTFCHQLAHREPAEVDPHGVAQFLHAQDAAEHLIEVLDSNVDGESSCEGTQLTIPELFERLKGFHETYCIQDFPELPSRFDLQLFNTLRSYLFPKAYPIPLKSHVDPRGAFFELARGYGPTQVSVSTTKPNVTRGNHFHLEKVERFVVLSGEAMIKIRRLFDGKVHEFVVSGAEPCALDMPTLNTHNISNIGVGELITAFWSNDHFTPQNPDTYSEPVELRVQL